MLAVIFTATLRQDAPPGYAEAGERLRKLVVQMPGFLGQTSAREGTLEITVSYWNSGSDLAAWRDHPEHRALQERGRRDWYAHYDVRVCQVDRSYQFDS